MKAYEAVVIFSSDDAQYQAGREFLKKEFEGSGITVTKEDDMGDRLLAYLAEVDGLHGAPQP